LARYLPEVPPSPFKGPLLLSREETVTSPEIAAAGATQSHWHPWARRVPWAMNRRPSRQLSVASIFPPRRGPAHFKFPNLTYY
jgi:hypothetical protein